MITSTTSTIETNELIENLPSHLKQFIKPQDYDQYTPINQAVWRYVMKKNIHFLKNTAHESYLSGLELTGIETEKIPSMYGMNRILRQIGWAAVAVDGFIPPSAFMEFMAYKILVIAADIRQIEHIEYTPAPDIIHESAGHAPIIANPDYAEYLRRIGEIGAKAILSKHDVKVYEAIRKLSILKEADGTPLSEIEKAEEAVKKLQNEKVPFSEMAQIRNLLWWSVEYGLIGDIDNPKIYGAGLLSSIGESKWCLSKSVEKIPYSSDVTKQGFDITKPQPQLYVTPDFPYLMQVLEECADSMSVRTGGLEGVQKLIDSELVGTVELNTGLQISGKFTRVITNKKNEIVFIRSEGPTALAYRDKELLGHGREYHSHGYSTPIGNLKHVHLAIEDMGPVDLKAYDFYDGKWLSFEFESGIKVEGMNITGFRNVKGKLMLISLKECTITHGDEILFKPEYGVFDMAVGKSVISAYAGAADSRSFPNLYETSKTLTINPIKTDKVRRLEEMYLLIGKFREGQPHTSKELNGMFLEIQEDHPNEWLLPLEIIEICQDKEMIKNIIKHLNTLKSRNPSLDKLIDEGLEMFYQY